MRNRTIVLQRLLATFVQRRDDSILRHTLPPRHEYVIPVRMTPWQELLYTTVSCWG
jgi:transcriptional regulator ATRX